MTTQRLRSDKSTAVQILDVAERLVQRRGFNAFSYADVAAELAMTKAALHYHFANKAELGEALITRYASRFSEALARIDRESPDGWSKLEAYVDLYREVLSQERMCLCGMLAADYPTLPPPMRATVVRFFDDNEEWLARILEEGVRDRTVRFAGSSREAARMIVDVLEGAMLIARPYGDMARFQATAARLLADFAPRKSARSAAPAGRVRRQQPS